LKSQYDVLIDFPKVGAPRDHVSPGLRVLIHGNYASYYRIEDRQVVIVRVFHGHRDIVALAAQGGFNVT
jgi:toxin ParE1/3/4